MKCPICRTPVPLTNPFLPFCSERCKLIDLGNWSSGKYVISTPLKPGDAPSGSREGNEDDYDD